MGQVPAQVPLLQTPEAQTRRQAPQWLGLVLRFTQTPPQEVWPMGQGATQLPARQTWPVPQAVPSGDSRQTNMVPALQTRQGPPHEVAQQKPPMQEPEVHSRPSMQAAPAGFFVHTPP